ncbi:acyl-CoA dehydrogenase family protein [Methylobacterium brachiatum]|uniref:Alkylation response protein AidB-like acyl-CoA dehydrogenase n=1 Tax=Methylobacterium brachiatum TaxID=269660 RepID=A0AAJ1TTL3_9HYPH|nr:acyl-CoA dehydrogenase family protein [Methylobacterium brachiatum]MCB4801778.1 acyl-CoA/acyl-ACP dehydrogenase [Methylobacterium brachiatum]MDH2313421.1 acyl-CoA/acyl-ACP dehydrogenase [Methylobacterium brachiatum]MDQ0544689.1 alkylation response protein AidB-like acyl-CoA dehydrogenase [Methylobacterium brachiatum]
MDLRLDDIAWGTRGDPVAAARAVAAGAARRAGRHDHDGGFPAEDVAELARVGLLAAPVPRRDGGAGLGEEPDGAILRAVLTRIGAGSLALGRVYEGHVNAVQLVARFASGEARNTLLADAAQGHLFGVWNTEPPGQGLKIDGADGTRVLRGVKTFASGAGFVTRALVTAQPAAPGSQMIVVALEPGERADLSAWRAQGMRASATGTVDFTGLGADRFTPVGAPDDYQAQPHFSGGAWRFLAVQLGGLEALLDAWRGHLVATGRGEDPHQLARLGEGVIAAETARLWVARAAAIVGEEGDPDGIIAYVNLARLAVERAGLDLLERAQRSVGLQGFLRDHPLERLTRDLATYLRQPGPDRALTEGARHVLRAPLASGDLWLDEA